MSLHFSRLQAYHAYHISHLANDANDIYEKYEDYSALSVSIFFETNQSFTCLFIALETCS